MPEYSSLLTTSKKEITNMGLYRSSSHVFWRCKYHLVWTPKYRFKILRDKVGKELYRTIYILCNMKDCEVLEAKYSARSCASGRDSPRSYRFRR